MQRQTLLTEHTPSESLTKCCDTSVYKDLHNLRQIVFLFSAVCFVVANFEFRLCFNWLSANTHSLYTGTDVINMSFSTFTRSFSSKVLRVNLTGKRANKNYYKVYADPGY